MQERSDLEKTELKYLAAYAQTSAESRGRYFEEGATPWRTGYQRDRDRIVHSRAFRELEYKAQLFLNPEVARTRSRLGHAVEAASLARGLARTLRLNEDLAESIALAASAGFPPLGHPGEETLSRLMRDFGGFHRRSQSARVLSELEIRYPEFNGINLSWEVLEGLSPSGQALAIGGTDPANEGFTQPSLEAQAALAAEEIAFICNDLEDGLSAELLSDADVSRLAPWTEVEQKVLRIYARLDPSRRRSYVLRCLIEELLGDVIQASSERLDRLEPRSADEARRLESPLIGFSEKMGIAVRETRTLLQHRLYYHPDLGDENSKSVRMLEQLFEVFLGHEHLLPAPFSIRIKKEGIQRCSCDYLASLGDDDIRHLHERLVGDEAITATKLEQPALFE